MSLSLAQNVIVVGADNRPPMLDKTNYSSWESRMVLYIRDEEKIRESVDIKLAKDMHTTNFDHLYAHLRKHEAHASEVRLTRQRYPDQIALVDNSPSCLNLTQYYRQLSPATQQYYLPPAPQHSYDAPMDLLFHLLTSYDDLIASLNKAIAFLRTTFSSRFPQINNQLRTLSNPRNQATIHDGRVTIQTIQGRQTQGYSNNGVQSNVASQGVNRNGGVNTTGAYLDPKQLAFLANNGDTFTPVQASQEIPSPVAFQINELDAFDSNCDDEPSAKAVLMANLSSYDSNVISEVPFHDKNIENDMSYQSVQETQCFEQPSFDNEIEVDITSDSNIISYEQYWQEIENLVVQDTSSPAQQDELLMYAIKEMSSQVAKCNKVQHENKLVNETLTVELERYKEQVSKQKEDKYLDEVIDLQKKIKALDNVVYKMGQKVPALYDGYTIFKQHDALFILDTKETLDLAEESRLKMLAKQNDPSLKDKKVKFTPVNYVALNKLFEHFVTHFVPQKQLSAEQAFWLPISQPVFEKPPVSSVPVLKKEIPRELPTIRLVKDSFHKMKEHINKFDETITFHTKITGNRIGSWGVEHIKGAFEKDVKHFAQILKEYFHMFENGLYKELKDMKAVFNQIETEVAKCSVDRK
ncbi:hypothetical protein Tco_1367851 [Tanacetum coccineum]